MTEPQPKRPNPTEPTSYPAPGWVWFLFGFVTSPFILWVLDHVTIVIR